MMLSLKLIAFVSVLLTLFACSVNDTKEVSEEFIAKARIVGEELKDTYYRISKRLSK
jgi:hypothetical protein